jgi:hypothetical protein
VLKVTDDIVRTVPVSVTETSQPTHRYKEYASSNAIFVVREAPRLGARAADVGRAVVDLLVSRNLVARAPTGRIVFATDDFIVDTAQEQDQERFTIAYTLASPTVQVAASGRQPRLYTYTGAFLHNLQGKSGLSRWLSAWEEWLRATASLRGEARRISPYVAEIYYRDQLRRGYLVSMAFERSADQPARSSFSVTMFVVHGALLGSSGSPTVVSEPPVVSTSRAAPIGLDRFIV